MFVWLTQMKLNQILVFQLEALRQLLIQNKMQCIFTLELGIVLFFRIQIIAKHYIFW